MFSNLLAIPADRPAPAWLSAYIRPDDAPFFYTAP
jgi:hypothetical protein